MSSPSRDQVSSNSVERPQDLTASYHNRNKDQSRVMVSKIVDNPSQQVQGLYKDSMNKGTSQVNWDDITSNQQKIAEYKKRMLGQK